MSTIDHTQLEQVKNKSKQTCQKTSKKSRKKIGSGQIDFFVDFLKLFDLTFFDFDFWD